ncbi:MAG: hypothetical protein M3Y53_11160 [Thermoproteota archaeon]|nr:hypothetical protein [Thermoproteota archaeon]
MLPSTPADAFPSREIKEDKSNNDNNTDNRSVFLRQTVSDDENTKAEEQNKGNFNGSIGGKNTGKKLMELLRRNNQSFYFVLFADLNGPLVIFVIVFVMFPVIVAFVIFLAPLLELLICPATELT